MSLEFGKWKLEFEGTTAGVPNHQGLECMKYLSELVNERDILVELTVYGRKIRLILPQPNVSIWNILNLISHPPRVSWYQFVQTSLTLSPVFIH
jgi:hypothetical protein